MWAQFGLVPPPDGEPADPRHVEAARKRLAIELVERLECDPAGRSATAVLANAGSGVPCRTPVAAANDPPHVRQTDVRCPRRPRHMTLAGLSSLVGECLALNLLLLSAA